MRLSCAAMAGERGLPVCPRRSLATNRSPLGGLCDGLDFCIIYATLSTSIYFEDGVTILSTIVTLPRTRRFPALSRTQHYCVLESAGLLPPSLGPRCTFLPKVSLRESSPSSTVFTIAPCCHCATGFCGLKILLIANRFEHHFIAQIDDAAEFFERGDALQHFHDAVLAHAADFLVRRSFPNIALT